jgi:TonB family protein
MPTPESSAFSPPSQDSPQTANRRASPRHTLLSLCCVDLDEGTTGIVIDVSEGGLGVRAAVPIPQQIFPAMRFQLSGSGEWITVAGAVVWQSDCRRQAGVTFLDLPEHARQRLEESLLPKPLPELRCAQTPMYRVLRPLDLCPTPLTSPGIPVPPAARVSAAAPEVPGPAAVGWPGAVAAPIPPPASSAQLSLVPASTVPRRSPSGYQIIVALIGLILLLAGGQDVWEIYRARHARGVGSVAAKAEPPVSPGSPPPTPAESTPFQPVASLPAGPAEPAAPSVIPHSAVSAAESLTAPTRPFRAASVPAAIRHTTVARPSPAAATASASPPDNAEALVSLARRSPVQLVRAGAVVYRPGAGFADDSSASATSAAVTVAVVIGPDGRVSDASAVSGPEDLHPDALAAVRAWRFEPDLVAGRPVATSCNVTVLFRPR